MYIPGLQSIWAINFAAVVIVSLSKAHKVPGIQFQNATTSHKLVYLHILEIRGMHVNDYAINVIDYAVD